MTGICSLNLGNINVKTELWWRYHLEQDSLAELHRDGGKCNDFSKQHSRDANL